MCNGLASCQRKPYSRGTCFHATDFGDPFGNSIQVMPLAFQFVVALIFFSAAWESTESTNSESPKIRSISRIMM